jgi:GrpB-like predicted nucleotidyltransferase (UPF0157 family)
MHSVLIRFKENLKKIAAINSAREAHRRTGVKKGQAVLSAPKPIWGKEFEQEQKMLSTLLQIPEERIIHFGSTAVPDCRAKDIIDIAIRFSSLRETWKVRSILATTEYGNFPCYFLSDRICYTKGEPQLFHLYLVDENSSTFFNWMIFKKILTENESIKREYIALKNTLAEAYKDNRLLYTEKKTAFIYDILNRNTEWTNQISRMTL